MTLSVGFYLLLTVAGSAATNSAKPRYIHLPYGMEEQTMVLKTQQDWESYEANNRTYQETTTAPCDWDSEMLVAWRSPTGTSGCSAPDAGISKIEHLPDRVQIKFYSGAASGNCQAYFQPLVAACLPATELPVDVEAGPGAMIYVPARPEPILIEVPASE